MGVLDSMTHVCMCNGQCKECTCSLEEKKEEESKEEKIERVRDNFMDRFMKVE